MGRSKTKVVNCLTCNKEIRRRKYCSMSCFRPAQNKKVVINCNHCGKETKNKKFCSRSCSASVNNVLHPKIIKQPPKTKSCSSCDNIVSIRCNLCKTCHDNYFMEDSITLKEAIVRYNQHHKSSAFALVRTRARIIAANNSMNFCYSCGYTKHIEICHVKAISSFDLETKVSVVNDLLNLLPLCPNCHWEFDNIGLSVNGITKIE